MLHKFLITVFFMVLSLPSVVNGSLKFSDRSEEYYLENGLKVVLIEDKRSPSVVNSIWYRVGSSDEVEGKTGISHILEHMMFKGTSNLGPGEFSSVVKKMGGTENAFTSKDFTGYFQKVHFTDLEKCIELEADRMINLKLDEKEIESEIKVVKEERRLRTDDNPISKTFEKIMINAYGMNDYGIPIIGTMNDIDATTKEDLRNWYDRYYQPENAIVIIAGNFDKTNVKKFIRKYYGSINNQRNSYKNIDKVDFITKEYFEVQENVSKAVVFLSFKKPEFNNERLREIYALDLFIEIMDGGYSSRLTNNLVNTEKIALDTFISNDTYNQHSNLIIIGGTPRGDTSTEYFKKQILNQFSSDSINTITDKELSRAKARIKANNVFKFDSVFYQAMQVGMLETKNISWKELDKYNSITESITLNEVKAAGKKFISDQPPLVTILNPKK
ncbi:MAG: pitrilysin family protein [Gammaproteobacteria bacterium]